MVFIICMAYNMVMLFFKLKNILLMHNVRNVKIICHIKIIITVIMIIQIEVLKETVAKASLQTSFEKSVHEPGH